MDGEHPHKRVDLTERYGVDPTRLAAVLGA
jgi:hypothetical protein